MIIRFECEPESKGFPSGQSMAHATGIAEGRNPAKASTRTIWRVAIRETVATYSRSGYEALPGRCLKNRGGAERMGARTLVT